MTTVSSREPTPARPTQAVIVAGGRGTRLRPLTDTRPKPMIEFHGRPFLEYIVEMLREQGLERILLLLGYRAEQVQEHFGDGSALGVHIDYSVTGPDDFTGSRMRRAADLMDDQFVFLYCDNYWPMDLERMWAAYREARTTAMVTVYSNKDGYTRDNVRVEGCLVADYDPARQAPGLAGVEIGYALLTKSVLDLLPSDDAMFEKAVYPQLVADGQLAAFVTDHRYYSVGSHERLTLTDAFLAREQTIILDRDGVLNKRPPRAQYVTKPEQLEWLPGALEALALLRDRGYRVVVVSNQAGVARGAMSLEDLAKVNRALVAGAASRGGRIDAVYCCPHGWDEGCECRKPEPGMLFQAQRDLHLDLSRTYFIGDDERDGQAAAAAGSPFILVSDGEDLLRAVRAVTDQQQEALT